MKSHFLAFAIVLAGLPALAWGQAPCGCSPRSASVIRPAAYGAWADYQPAGYADCGGCGGCSACCDPCCRPLLCIIPNTVRKIGRTLDCLLPCGPRSGHGCGISCIGAGSGCASCTSGCPSCTGGVPVGNPFQDDELAPPLPPKPAPQETRYQKSVMAPRSVAVAPRAASKSVLTRNTQRVSHDVSQTNHLLPVVIEPDPAVKRTSNSSAATASRSSSIPHNPLR
jgi:hypothetical protein